MSKDARQRPDRSGVQGPTKWFHLERFSAPLRPIFVNFAMTDAHARYHYTPHRHSVYEFMYIWSGRYRCLLNNVPLSLRPGNILVIKPGDMHEDFIQRGVHTYGLQFHFVKDLRVDAPDAIFIKTIQPAAQTANVHRSRIADHLKVLEHETDLKDPFSRYIAEAHGTAVFWIALRHFPANRLHPDIIAGGRDRMFSAELLDYFHRHETSSVSISEMAAAFGLSVGFFAHRCTQCLGVPPAQAFARYRMHAAASLLTGGKNVAETSRMMGFVNPYHFSRMFRKVMGKPPVEFTDRSTRKDRPPSSPPPRGTGPR